MTRKLAGGATDGAIDIVVDGVVDGAPAQTQKATRSKRAPSDATHAYRLAKAVTFVLALLLTIPGLDALLSGGPLAEGAGTAPTGIDATALVGTADPLGALENIERLSAPSETTLPDALAEEVAIPPDARDVRANEATTVVSYLLDCDQGDALDQVKACMRDRGWRSVPLGDLTGATFLKDGGTYTWALATCTQTGPATTVVVRC